MILWGGGVFKIKEATVVVVFLIVALARVIQRRRIVLAVSMAPMVVVAFVAKSHNSSNDDTMKKKKKKCQERRSISFSWREIAKQSLVHKTNPMWMLFYEKMFGSESTVVRRLSTVCCKSK